MVRWDHTSAERRFFFVLATGDCSTKILTDTTAFVPSLIPATIHRLALATSEQRQKPSRRFKMHVRLALFMVVSFLRNP